MPGNRTSDAYMQEAFLVLLACAIELDDPVGAVILRDEVVPVEVMESQESRPRDARHEERGISIFVRASNSAIPINRGKRAVRNRCENEKPPAQNPPQTI